MSKSSLGGMTGGYTAIFAAGNRQEISLRILRPRTIEPLARMHEQLVKLASSRERSHCVEVITTSRVSRTTERVAQGPVVAQEPRPVVVMAVGRLVVGQAPQLPVGAVKR